MLWHYLHIDSYRRIDSDIRLKQVESVLCGAGMSLVGVGSWDVLGSAR